MVAEGEANQTSMPEENWPCQYCQKMLTTQSIEK